MERAEIVRWNDATDHDQDIRASLRGQFMFQLRNKRQMTCCEGRYTDNVDIVLHGLPSHFGGGCEKRADIDVEAQIGECRGDDLLPTIVSILADFCDKDARAASIILLEPFAERDHAAYLFVHFSDLLAVNARNGACFGAMAAEDLF